MVHHVPIVTLHFLSLCPRYCQASEQSDPKNKVKTGVLRGIPILLIFGQKHRLWVIVRTPSRGGSNMYPQSMF